MKARGYVGIGIYRPKHSCNVGTLLRSAYCFGAQFVFTVGRRYAQQSSDTAKTHRSVPLFHFDGIDDLRGHLPYSCPLVGVEITEGAHDLRMFSHLERECLLLGAEDGGLPKAVLDKCHAKVVIGGLSMCLNVATAGSIVLYDRACKLAERSALRRGDSPVYSG